ncbi:cytochrome P450 4F11-like [Patiria miniata]|uniref:Cytochrome P450 n=1 Tax=Patiria miniata TaxID=46514 RepID=A0A913ZG59_PATMI|nr:cytochrome P450 4F11-like [Patiria miniata]
MLFQVFCVVLALAFCLGPLLKALRKRGAIGKLPCPPGRHWFHGHAKQGPFDPGFKWLMDTVKTFPRIYTLWLGPVAPLPMLVHPDTIKPILNGTVKSKKSPLYDSMRDWIGEGLALSEGAKWKRNRRLLTRSFHLDVLRAYTPVSNDCVEILLDKLERSAAQDKPFNMYQGLVQCTFDVIQRTACSYKSDCQVEKPKQSESMGLVSACETLLWFIHERQFNNRLLLNPLIFRLSSNYGKYEKALQYVHDFATKMVKERMEEVSKKKEAGNPITKPRDFLDTLVMARDEDGSGLTIKEMVDEVNTFLFAGHETTATSSIWLLFFLAKHPQHQNKIRQEVDELLADRDSDTITFKDFGRLEYMTLAIKESMRMITAGALFSRTLLEPYTVDGVTLPEGTMVGLSFHQLHHNPTVWGDDHMEFKPSRFLPEDLSKMDPFCFAPFSAGARNCIGQQFALNEMKVFVARILRRFRLSLVAGEPDPIPTMTLVSKPKKPLFLKIESVHMKS